MSPRTMRHIAEGAARMSEQSSPPPAASKPWYLKWWVWLIAAFLVAGGISAIVNPKSLSSCVCKWAVSRG